MRPLLCAPQLLDASRLLLSHFRPVLNTNVDSSDIDTGYRTRRFVRSAHHRRHRESAQEVSHERKKKRRRPQANLIQQRRASSTHPGTFLSSSLKDDTAIKPNHQANPKPAHLFPASTRGSLSRSGPAPAPRRRPCSTASAAEPGTSEAARPLPCRPWPVPPDRRSPRRPSAPPGWRGRGGRGRGGGVGGRDACGAVLVSIFFVGIQLLPKEVFTVLCCSLCCGAIGRVRFKEGALKSCYVVRTYKR